MHTFTETQPKSLLNQTKYISRNSFTKHDFFHEICYFSIRFPNNIIRAGFLVLSV